MEKYLGLTISIDSDTDDRRLTAELDFPRDRLTDKSYMAEMISDVIEAIHEQARLQGEMQARGLRVGGVLQTSYDVRPNYLTPTQANVRKKMTKRSKKRKQKKLKSAQAAMFGG